MKMSFRWYGLGDSIPLQYIKQIPNMHSVVTAVYDSPVGDKWSSQSVAALKAHCDKHNIAMEVIESVPVHEDIKLGRGKRDLYIDNYCKNIELLAKFGVKCICYNFMPVFDWVRTGLNSVDETDGSNSLLFDSVEIAKLDPKNLSLPGWDESYSKEELSALLNSYKDITHGDLFDNLVYFLKRIIPVCEKCDVDMAIHPDDPPWDIFGLPRIITDEQNMDKLFALVPSKRNGVTFCTGSFGAGRQNDLIRLAGKYAAEGRIKFVHLRNILFLQGDGFKEVAHYSQAGSLDMAAIVKELVINGFEGYVRPDHGRNIWGENGKPGYGLYDRALGAAYLNGLFEAFSKEYKELKK